MKKIEIGHYTHKGYDIYEARHPKLLGKYEIYLSDDFIEIAGDLITAKIIIDAEIKKINYAIETTTRYIPLIHK